MENHHSHHAPSPLPIILSGATRSLGSEDEGGKRRAEPVEAGGGIGPFPHSFAISFPNTDCPKLCVGAVYFDLRLTGKSIWLTSSMKNRVIEATFPMSRTLNFNEPLADKENGRKSSINRFPTT